MSSTFARKMGIPHVTLDVAKAAMRLSSFTKDPVNFIGETGVGKTEGTEQEARQHGFEPYIFNVYNRNPDELSGPMYPTEDGESFKNIPPEKIPTGDDEGKMLLALDEINRANDYKIQPMMPVLQKGKLGMHQLGKNVIVHSAMNPPKGDYNVGNMVTQDPAMRQRVCHISVKFSEVEYLEYCKNPKEKANLTKIRPLELDHNFLGELDNMPWNPSIMDWQENNMNAIMDDKAREAGKVFANPSSLKLVNRMLHAMEHFDIQLNAFTERVIKAKIGGHLGKNNANDIFEYIKNKKENFLPVSELAENYLSDEDIYKKFHRLQKEGHNKRVALLAQYLPNYIFQQDNPLDYVDVTANLINDMKPAFRYALQQAITDEGKREGGSVDKGALNFQTKLTQHPKYAEKDKEEIEQVRKMEDQINF